MCFYRRSFQVVLVLGWWDVPAPDRYGVAVVVG